MTRPVVEVAAGVDGLEFDRIGEVRLKGFSEPTELFIAVAGAASATMVEEVREAVRAGGLFARDRPVVAMLSGGRDSTCLLDVAVALLGAGARQRAARQLRPARAGRRRRAPLRRAVRAARRRARGRAASRPRVPRTRRRRGRVAGRARRSRAERAPAGNLQAWARELRYAGAAHAPARARRADRHRAHRQRPGRDDPLPARRLARAARAARHAAPRDGRLIRPLLGVTREQTAAYCPARGLQWREDESNEDERYARARVRHGLAAGAARGAPGGRGQRAADRARCCARRPSCSTSSSAPSSAGARSIALARLRELPAALARLVVVRLAEQAAGTYVPQAGDRVEEILALGRRGGRAELHVGGRAGAVIEDGTLAMVRLPRAPRAPAGALPREGLDSPAWQHPRASPAEPARRRGARQRRGAAAPRGRARARRSRATTPGARCCSWACSRAPCSS